MIGCLKDQQLDMIIPIRPKEKRTKVKKEKRTKGQRDTNSQKYIWSFVLHLRDVYILVVPFWSYFRVLFVSYWYFLLPLGTSWYILVLFGYFFLFLTIPYHLFLFLLFSFRVFPFSVLFIHFFRFSLFLPVSSSFFLPFPVSSSLFFKFNSRSSALIALALFFFILLWRFVAFFDGPYHHASNPHYLSHSNNLNNLYRF